MTAQDMSDYLDREPTKIVEKIINTIKIKTRAVTSSGILT